MPTMGRSRSGNGCLHTGLEAGNVLWRLLEVFLCLSQEYDSKNQGPLPGSFWGRFGAPIFGNSRINPLQDYYKGQRTHAMGPMFSDPRVGWFEAWNAMGSWKPRGECSKTWTHPERLGD